MKPLPETTLKFRATVDRPWADMEPIRVGDVPAGCGTPARYVTVEQDKRPLARIDVYRAKEAEAFPFEDARVWGAYIVIGFGHRAFLVDIENRCASTFELGEYFGHAYSCDSCLLIASAERLFRVDPDGKLKWESDVLGIDGVVVEKVSDELIEGQGEWDPPGGWRPFRIELESGKPAL